MGKHASLALTLSSILILILTGCIGSETVTQTVTQTQIQTTTLTQTITETPTPPPRLIFSSQGISDTPEFIVNKPNWKIEYEVSRDCFLTIKIQPYYERYLIRSLLVKAGEINQITMEGYTGFRLYFSVEAYLYSTGGGAMLTVPEWTISVIEN